MEVVAYWWVIRGTIVGEIPRRSEQEQSPAAHLWPSPPLADAHIVEPANARSQTGPIPESPVKTARRHCGLSSRQARLARDCSFAQLLSNRGSSKHQEIVQTFGQSNPSWLTASIDFAAIGECSSGQSKAGRGIHG